MNDKLTALDGAVAARLDMAAQRVAMAEKSDQIQATLVGLTRPVLEKVQADVSMMSMTLSGDQADATSMLLSLVSRQVPFIEAMADLHASAEYRKRVASTLALSTPSSIAVAQVAGPGARRAIGMLAIIVGFASTVFWPLSGALDVAVGWRGTLLVYAAIHLFACAPIHLLVLPHRPPMRPGWKSAAQPPVPDWPD